MLWKNMCSPPLSNWFCVAITSHTLSEKFCNRFSQTIWVLLNEYSHDRFRPIDYLLASICQMKRLVSSMWRPVPDNQDVHGYEVVKLDQLYQQPPNSNWIEFLRNILLQSNFSIQISKNLILCYLWNEYRYRLSSTGTKSIIIMYIACGSRPHSLTWNVGNIRRPVLVTIISVPCSWNLSHNCFVSNITIACARAGWLDVGWKKKFHYHLSERDFHF